MERSSFFKQTAFLALAVTVIQMALGSSFTELAEHQNLFWVSQFVFLALTIFSFWGGKYFVKKANKNWFSQFIIILIFTRLLLSIALVIGYFNIYQPNSKLFLLPFFLVYISYTVFEVYCLARVGRES